jgi:serine/threonine-protein kinase HipA
MSAGTSIRTGTDAGQEPQMGYPELARLFRRAGVAIGGANMQDARELFRRMVFNILIDNTNDHEKNHSLLVVSPFQHGRLRLTICCPHTRGRVTRSLFAVNRGAIQR